MPKKYPFYYFLMEAGLKTSSAFGRDMSCVKLWLALQASHKCFQHMAGPSGQLYVYIHEKIPNILGTG